MAPALISTSPVALKSISSAADSERSFPDPVTDKVVSPALVMENKSVEGPVIVLAVPAKVKSPVVLNWA